MPSPEQTGVRLPSPPEAVFLDLGDTLVRAHPSWAGVYAVGLAGAGIRVDEDELARALLAATTSGAWSFEGPFEATEEASYQRVKQFDAQVLAALGHGDLHDEVFRAIEAAFARASSWHVFPDVLPAVEVLRGAGIRLGVISNWLWGAPELVHAIGLARHFETLVISARVGYQKPHPRIFEHALESMGVSAARCVHAGDSYVADVLGARRVGIWPVLVERHSADPARLRHEYDDPGLPIVRDMLELLDLLGVDRPAAVAPS